MSASASGKVSAKKRSPAAGAAMDAKEASPSNGRKSVQVKLPSRLGSAMSMKFLRGQMCSAFFANENPPPGAGGMVSSL